MRKLIAIGLAFAGLGLAGPAAAQTPEGQLQISGTSSVRAWECKEADIQTKLTASSGFAEQVLAGQKAVDAVSLTFPVEKIDCGNGKMNEHMRNALKAEKYPTIAYKLTAYEIGQAISAGTVPVKVDGQMTIAGTTKPMSMDVTVSQAANGGMRVQGEQSFTMTEFGVKPPTLMFGTLKVGDEVHVKFDVVLSASTLALLDIPAGR